MPYKVLIVDDEPLARAGLRTLYDWNANGFQVVGEASNGKRALTAMKDVHVDIVITDIAMPVMDGLEFSKAARKQYPNTKIILLSCHNEFDFACEAMRLGASDYLLKAQLEPGDLHRSLSHLHRQITQERRTLGERSLIAALDGFDDWRNPAEDDRDDSYFISVCTPERQSFDHYDRLKDMFYRVVPNGYASRYGSKQTVMWLPAKDECSALQMMAQLHLLWLDAGLGCTVGLSGLCLSSSELRTAYSDAAAAAQRQFFEGSGRVYTLAKRGAESKKETNKFNECKTALMNALQQGFTEKAYEMLVKIVSAWDEAFTRDEVASQAKELMHVFLSAERAHKADLADQLAEIERCPHIQALKAFLFTSFDRLCPVNEGNEDYHGKCMQKAVDYIKRSYTDDIGLADVASHVSMSRNYFSEQFKKHTGLTFIDFLTNTRLQAAKKLLQEEQFKIYEVAVRSGFNDVKHFSKRFKKVFGQSPKEFQGK